MLCLHIQQDRVLRLEEERRTLTGAKGMTAITRLNAVNRELTGEKQEAGDIETNGLYYYLRTAEKELADFEASLAKAEAAGIIIENIQGVGGLDSISHVDLRAIDAACHHSDTI